MAKPVPGDIEYAYKRMYIVVNPNAAYGPPTYRISNPDELAGPDGGGPININGVEPIMVNTQPDNGKSISIDITTLPTLS